eukprot:tig00020892_g14918.t1
MADPVDPNVGRSDADGSFVPLTPRATRAPSWFASARDRVLGEIRAAAGRPPRVRSPRPGASDPGAADAAAAAAAAARPRAPVSAAHVPSPAAPSSWLGRAFPPPPPLGGRDVLRGPRLEEATEDPAALRAICGELRLAVRLRDSRLRDMERAIQRQERAANVASAEAQHLRDQIARLSALAGEESAVAGMSAEQLENCMRQLAATEARMKTLAIAKRNAEIERRSRELDDLIRVVAENCSDPAAAAARAGPGSAAEAHLRAAHGSVALGAGPKGARECCVCLVEYASVAMVPCGHRALCGPCSGRLEACPVCRRRASSLLVVYD